MDIYIGAIQLFPYGYAPDYWINCIGQLLSVQQYTALFSLLGTKFGGDGKTTFGLPDLRNAAPYSSISSYCINSDGIYPTPI